MSKRINAETKTATTMKNTFKSASVGTIRGPWICGTGVGPDTGIQYAVRLHSECWGYVIQPIGKAMLAIRKAEQMAANEKLSQPSVS